MNLLIVILASFLIWIMFLGVVALWVIDGRVKKETALHSLLSASISWTLANMIKSVYPTLRPFHLNGGEILTFTESYKGAAFPSSHSAIAFALAVTIWLHNRRLGTIFLLAAIGVAAGRVLANVHFTVDVIVGGLIGVLVGIIIDKLHVYKLVTGLDKNKKGRT